MEQLSNVTVVARNVSKTYKLGHNGSELNLSNFRRPMTVKALSNVSFVAHSGECIGAVSYTHLTLPTKRIV